MPLAKRLVVLLAIFPVTHPRRRSPPLQVPRLLGQLRGDVTLLLPVVARIRPEVLRVSSQRYLHRRPSLAQLREGSTLLLPAVASGPRIFGAPPRSYLHRRPSCLLILLATKAALLLGNSILRHSSSFTALFLASTTRGMCLLCQHIFFLSDVLCRAETWAAMENAVGGLYRGYERREDAVEVYLEAQYRGHLCYL